MRWVKRGLIYKPNGSLWWNKTHGYLPTADVVEEEGIIRIYFAGWDDSRVGRIGYVEVEMENPKKIIRVTNEPILDVGERGTFDDNGVSPCCVLDVGKEKFLYYFGWQRTRTVPYLLFCGLAISSDGGRSFKRYARVPILDRTDSEPWLRSAVTILQEDNRFRMWYVAGVGWIDLEKRAVPTYNIRYAESEDGIHWHSTGHVCIDFANDDEFGFGRPWIIKDGNIYRLWYSIRSRSRAYRMGYAESKDGIFWVRKDEEVGIEPSEEGWDSEMICFPCVVRVGSRWLMFYNGNRHGIDGFGYAELVEE